ncbi:16S rRNA (guanine(966)-N(2))-methyltransferase RsmD [Sulfitobacter sp. D35]|uniref:16S rRNA (guanine(966)-N(2))-methyltransferase RsmD n=1 Tax=Sulfitobacter sp. D35 TaxID=3083252 RepID=UPI00296F365D|nr:16S rRNA (guanine(966)-N(2))-methyltransferase RsmD [Sulfitobacter sp. D35]MDW4500156.1 16S rRNA (guanine(966)-N(2))-methyltransferase RsmD [Sulfitobacter sp. D35]
MRIVAGRFRSVPLASVGKGDRGAHLRPTADRVRESLFNLLGNRGAVEGARVLDLFAGTGALGLEAISRGAREAVFVDDGRVAQKLIRENIARLGVTDCARLLRRDATRLGACDGDGFDLVFLDPPYGKGLGEKALASAASGGWLAPGGLVVWEENAEMSAPDGFEAVDRRRYGDTHVTLLLTDPA